MAYLPSLALSTIHNTTSPDPTVTSAGELDFTSQLYAHNDFVDAPPGFGDLYWSGAVNSSPITTKWQTWLVGGLGGGGNLGGVIGGVVDPAKGNITSATANNGVGEIYAINITNPLTPANVSGGSATVASNIMGDWTTNTIVCDTVSGITDKCNAHMGNTYGTPTIRRLHSGNWGIIFGNGLNSADGTAGIFIIEITGGSANKPNFTIHYIDTGAGPSSDPTGNGTVNGISYATPADLDGDHVTDYVYAGDALGNVWRFDLTSNNAGSWGSPVKIFTASTAGSLQPITSSVVVAGIPYNGSYGVIVNFGTGRQIQQTLTGATGYTTGSQYLYGVWDWNMAAWNALGSKQYYYRTSGITSGLSNLTSESVVSGGNLSNATVCYSFMVSCTGTPSVSYGWYLNLVSGQEQFIYNPTIYNGIIYVNSIIPPDQQTQTTSCTAQPSSGNTYSINAATGNFTGQAVYNLSGVGTPFFVGTQGTSGGVTTQVTTLITQTLNGPVTQQIPNQGSTVGPATRLTWLELR
jgi:type IV pilus assembly protein PilY1